MREAMRKQSGSQMTGDQGRESCGVEVVVEGVICVCGNAQGGVPFPQRNPGHPRLAAAGTTDTAQLQQPGQNVSGLVFVDGNNRKEE